VAHGRLRHRLLTLYLWHISALPLAVLALYPLGFPQPQPGTGQWWALRPPWMLANAAGMVVLVVVFGRFETRAGTGRVPPSSPPRVVAAAVAAFSMATAILGAALTGFADPFGEGRLLLQFRMNPFQNLLHMIVGMTAALAAMRSIRACVAATLAIGIAFAAAGWLFLAGPGPLDVMGWNDATAVLHLILGSLIVVLILGTRLAAGGDNPTPSAGAVTR
jgi:hypothetical protein